MAEEKIYTLKELQKDIPEKQKAFCHKYIIRWNGTQSYQNVYKCSYDTAKINASKLLTKTNIQQYIAFIKDDIAKEAHISKLSLISELKKIAFSSVAQINEDWITRLDFNQLKKDNPDILDTIQEIDTKTIRKVLAEFNEEKKDFEKVAYDIEYVKIKLYDKTKAIQDILKAMGWNEPNRLNIEDSKIIFEFGGTGLLLEDFESDDSKE